MKYFKVLFLFLLLSGVVLATTPAKDLFIPAGARATGAFGTYWKTDLRVYNTCSQVANITIYYLPRATYSGHAAQTTAVLNAGEVRVFENVLETLFGITENTAGGFRITSNCDLVVESRTWTPGEVGTYGQRIPGIPKDHEVRAGEQANVLYIDNTADFRTNFGMIETSGQGSQVTLHLYDGNGTHIAQQDITLGAYESKQIDGVLSSFGISSGSNYRVVFQVVSGSAIPYSSQVDNSSGDPIYIDGSVARCENGGNGGGCPNGIFFGRNEEIKGGEEQENYGPIAFDIRNGYLYNIPEFGVFYIGTNYVWAFPSVNFNEDFTEPAIPDPIQLTPNQPLQFEIGWVWISSKGKECLEHDYIINLTWDGCSLVYGDITLTSKYLNTCDNTAWRDGQGKFNFDFYSGIQQSSLSSIKSKKSHSSFTLKPIEKLKIK